MRIYTNRTPLKTNAVLRLGGTEYRIDGFVGEGSNAVVYRASYADALHADLRHHVLVKELFPLSRQDDIVRTEEGEVRCLTEEGKAHYALHRESFTHGNRAHLRLLEQTTHAVSGNLNSFAENATLYTVLPFMAGETLEAARTCGQIQTLRERVLLMLAILDALDAFHQNGLLHLDISPDNILLSPYTSSTDALQRRVLLIDYNSVFSLEEQTGKRGLYYSIKENYCAPEIRLRDTASVGRRTDLFSLTAVFYELLAEAPPDSMLPRTGFGRAQEAPLRERYQAQSQTVVQKLLSILKKGLTLSPGRRYQAIAAYREDLQELLNRMDGRGVTHSALWDISLAQLRQAQVCLPAVELPVRLRAGAAARPHGEPLRAGTADPPRAEEILSAEAVRARLAKENLLLFGEGGIGKTTMLHRLWVESLARYSASAPVMLYLPLNRYKGEDGFIQRSIIDRVRLTDEMEGVRDALAALSKLMDAPLPDGAPAFVLLLDGLNEAGGRMGPLYEEIDSLSRKPGVRMVATSRTDDALRTGLVGFCPLALEPLDEAAVREALRQYGLPEPADQQVWALLHNPMLLTLYASAMEAGRRSGETPGEIATRDDVIALYLKGLCVSQQRAAVGDEQRQALIAYAMEHLLPSMALAMARAGGSLSLDALYRVVERQYQRMRSPAFAKAFPAYLGKSRLILQGARDAREWFDIVVSGLLQHTMRLLTASGDSYALSHLFFEEYLAPQGRAREKALRRARAIRALPRLSLALVACALAMTSAVLLWPPGPSFPTEADAPLLKEVMVSMNRSVVQLNLLITHERDMLSLAEALISGGKQSPDEFLQKAEEAERRAATIVANPLTNPQSNQRQTYDRLALRAPEGFTATLAIAEASMTHAGWAQKHVPLLREMITHAADGAQSAGVKQGVIDAYRAYLSLYCQYVMTAAARVHSTLDAESAAYLDQEIRAQDWSAFREAYSAVDSGQPDEKLATNMELLLSQCRDLDDCMGSLRIKCIMPPSKE